ncbi:aminotransferase class I/II-fold pyridoxal phosphate-dependent enzyme [Nocardioides convexus]|uniref:aminotransferase class I/II-fold pyridoxal phosphate-dependent enzyme n=1 Tax=Nocardioides convexus TaxID=2712224 RepID=UPI00241848A2|nr:aminotransferase class I/II-fold pyridoxal phosphate-dependent enzyme [Nocardioides convexus]
MTDEVYEHLTFDGRPHTPVATLPGMAERTLTLSSAGKSYSVTGWKVGWATGPADLVGAVTAAKQWLTYTSGAPLQPAVAVALDDEAGFPRRLAADLAARRDEPGRRAARGRPPDVPAGGHLLRDHRRLRPRLGQRQRLLPGAARAGGCGGDPRGGLLRRAGRPRRRAAPGPLGVLQAARGDRGGARAARRGRPQRVSPGIRRIRYQAPTSGRSSIRTAKPMLSTTTSTGG